MEENTEQKNKKTYCGIDVSHWNGDIKWKTVAGSGIEFAMLKCMNESNQMDRCFEANYQGCIKSGIYVGVYIYVAATTKYMAETVIDKLLEILRNRKIKYGVWLDVEDSRLRKIDPKDLTGIVDFMLKKLNDAGYTAGVYCNYNWYQAIFKGTPYLFWIARYPIEDDGSLHPQLDPGSVACWQYSSHGTVNGISGHVDLDLAKEDISQIKIKKSSLFDIIWEWIKEIISYFQ